MPERAPQGRYPGYDVLSKRATPSWNDKTRQVIDERLALAVEPRFFTAQEFATLEAIAARIVPQPPGRAAIPVAVLVDHRLHSGQNDGYRPTGMPREREAWRQGLRALDAEARDAHEDEFRKLSAADQDDLLARMQRNALKNGAWGGMSPKAFFETRLARDVVLAYYAHPTAWSEIGWGGPAAPRGYVRMDFDERDPWEAAEVKNGDVEAARRKNRNV